MSELNRYRELLEQETEARRALESQLRDKELALRACQQAVEEQVGDRTAELETAKQMAEQLNRSRMEFLASLGHEVRTPMNAIVGLSHLLRRSKLPQKRERQVGQLVEASQTLLSLFDDLLEFSRLEVGKLNAEEKSFNLEYLITSALSPVRGQFAEKGLSLHWQLPAGEHHWYIGDPVLLRKALLNYVTNALKYTESGSVSIVVQSAGVCEAGEKLVFEVQDSGMGIETEDIPDLFEPFLQLDESRVRRFQGSGLGLAITRRLISLMGGEVGVESAVGEGSRFWFTLCLKPGSPELEQQLHHKVEDIEEALRRSCLGCRILLVEDNELNSEVTEEFLSRVGLEVTIAEDGAEALEQARAKVFDLILMDIQLPVIDGLDATRLIRTLPGREDTPVLALTASTLEEDRIACRDAGMNDFVAKPVSPKRLYTSLLSWLGHGERSGHSMRGQR